MLELIWNVMIVVIGVTLGTFILVSIVGFWWVLGSTIWGFFS